MKKPLLTGIAALFLATGTAHAQESDQVLRERCENGATYWCTVFKEREAKRGSAAYGRRHGAARTA